MATLDRARAWALTPLLMAFMASSHVRQHSPVTYRLARRLDPVHRSPTGVVVLARHAEAASVLRDPRFGSSEDAVDRDALRVGLLTRVSSGRRPGSLNARPGDPRPYVRLQRRLLVFLDPPDHTRIRALVAKAFTPRRVERLEARVEEIVDELLAPALAAGRTEFMSDVAYPLPARVICELVGIPADDYPLFVEHAPGLAGSLDPSPLLTPAAADAADAAVEALSSYLDGLIAERRASPGDDLLSALVAEDGGATLSHDELVAIVLLLVMAGHETTANVLGNAVARVVADPGARASLARLADRDGPGDGGGPSMRTAVEEFLRLDGPVQMAQRVTCAPVRVGGADVPAGRIVLVLIGAANRDPAAFARPERLDLGRVQNPHLSFGSGPHYCVGASLARLELRVALRALARSLPAGARLAGPAPLRPSFTIRGRARLPLAW